jgi:PhnB protein
MDQLRYQPVISAVFITFSGNCKRALNFYQACFGGHLHFETFGEELPDTDLRPVVNGTLVSDRIAIHGSDLVHNEGRKLGNYIAVFLHCKNSEERKTLIAKLSGCAKNLLASNNDSPLVEIRDVFDVRWVLGV